MSTETNNNNSFLMEVIQHQADRIRWLERMQSYVKHREHCEPSNDGAFCSCGLLDLLARE